MTYAIYLGLFLPLLGFAILTATSGFVGRKTAGFIGCLSIFLSFVCFSWILYEYNHLSLSPIATTLYNWIPVEQINAKFTLRVDPLSILMTLIITGVGFLIHLYSNGYMEHDEDYARYFSCMNLFVFSMLLLVLAGDLVLLFVGWEGVGLASYLLIGYYYSRPAAAQAATKAFVINRIGDYGLLLGILLTFFLFGTSNIETITTQASQKFAVGAPIIVLLTLLYFTGAVGKSAQLPLYTWLPDAMEGPTPVSALIHAATMVTAGVYLVVRLHPIFLLAPVTLHIVGIIGGLTALFAALCAMAQTDLKRVLAYSTVSQLGYMFLACGVASFYAAMFHLTTHAFMKSLLFLSAGNVVHMMHGTTEMDKMGGLYKKFPATHWLFLIGALAMSGIPPLAGFFSKDLILEQEHVASYDVLFYMGLFTSVLTAFYLIRAYCLTFLGPYNLEGKVLNAIKEAPKIMVYPVALLAFLSIFGGFLGFSFVKTPLLESFLAEVGVTLYQPIDGEHFLFTLDTAISIIGALLGVGVAAVMYLKYRDQLGENVAFLRNSFYVNEIYWKIFGKPLKMVSKFIGGFFEPKVIDSVVKLSTSGTQKISKYLQKVQSGQIRSYVAWMVVGTVVLIACLVFY